MVYSTMGNAFTVDLSRLSARQLNAWWYSPRDGRCYNGQLQQTIHAHDMANTGGQWEFTPPTSGINQDWVLVLDDATRGFRPPGLAK
jgi:hypothetical protein